MSKAKVFRGFNGRWYWGHWCRKGTYQSGPVRANNMIGVPLSGSDCWERAFQAGVNHMKRCQ